MLMTVTELRSRLQGGGVVSFDCRFSLDDPKVGRRQYDAGHIPGAMYLDLEQDLSGPSTPASGRHPLPDPRELAAKLAHFGASTDKAVLVYDDGEGMVARAWWLIRYLGHEDVQILDGGFGAWLAAGYETSEEEPQPPVASFTPQVRSDWVVDVSDVERIVAGDRQAILIDARAAPRYRGEQEPLDPKAGHIPGATNVPWQEGIDAAKRWRDPEEQLRRFEPVLARGEEIVCYCGSGVTACADLFALELAGIRDAKLYPGSWSEWCADPRRGVATGPE